MLTLFKPTDMDEEPNNISINLNEGYIIDYSSALNLPELLTSISKQTAISIDLHNQEVVDYSGRPRKEQLLTSNTEIKILTVIQNSVLRDTFIVYSGVDSKIYVWSLHERKIHNILAGHKAKVNVIKPLPNGQIISAAKDNTIRLWELYSGACKQIIKCRDHTKYGAYNIITLKNNILATIHYEDCEELAYDRRVYLWDSLTGELVKILPCPDPLARESYLSLRIAALNEERFVVSYSNREKNSIYIWDSTDYTCEKLEKHQSAFPISLLVAMPNNKLAIGSSLGGFMKNQNNISIYNFLDDEIKTWALPSSESFTDLKVLSDGNIASNMRDGEVKVWNASNINHCLSTFNITDGKGFFEGLFASEHNIFVVLPDGKLVTSYNSKQLQCWNFPLRAIEAADIVKVLDALRVNHSVTSINLSGSPLDDKAAGLLAEILLKHPALQTIDLRGSKISKENIEKLVTVRHQAIRVITLHLDAAPQHILSPDTSIPRC